MDVRVRMAPSPTGFLHVGTARTALFNWLFAKKHNGKLILRIEDTDIARSTPEFEKDIIEQLKWLGIGWDEGPIRQSERLDLYETHLKRLLNEKKAYWCTCTKDELEAKRKEMLESGIAPRYDGACREKHLGPESGGVIRFMMPEHVIGFTDLIRGHIEFKGEAIGDIVIAKGLKEPLYNFAVVVDDEDMAITHVIRGEDGIANTPKQLALQAALGFRHPHYAHLPLILDANRAKMSKRNAATGLAEYRAAGYLPEALMNFLALIGWHPEGDREIMTPEEIAKIFTLERIQKGGGAFSLDKLNWMNAHYLRALSDAEIAKRIDWEESERNKKIIALVKPRAETLNDFATHGAFLLELPAYDAKLLLWKDMAPGAAKASLEYIIELIEQGDAATIPKFAERNGRGETFWPLRVALSGMKESPGPLEILHALGTDESLRRLHIAIKKLETPS